LVSADLEPFEFARAMTRARVLESRRQLIKKEMLSKDEGALFQIANQFDIRDRGADHKGTKRRLTSTGSSGNTLAPSN
jgi:hypothetical protein